MKCLRDYSMFVHIEYQDLSQIRLHELVSYTHVRAYSVCDILWKGPKCLPFLAN